jgi:hypothetical protein
MQIDELDTPTLIADDRRGACGRPARRDRSGR